MCSARENGILALQIGQSLELDCGGSSIMPPTIVHPAAAVSKPKSSIDQGKNQKKRH
jgi:hypothetical protein